MENYIVQFVFDYATISANCEADDPDSAPDLAWDWVVECGIVANRDNCIDIVVMDKDGEIA